MMAWGGEKGRLEFEAVMYGVDRRDAEAKLL